MSHRGQHDDRTDEPLDDATVEDLLAGCYHGEAPDLVALSELLGEVRSFSDRPAPLPSASLARMLADSAAASGAGVPTTIRGLVPDVHIEPSRRRGQDLKPATAPPSRSRWTSPPVVAAAVSAVLAAALVAAGTARLLPGSTQDVVAKFVKALTPFDFPEQRKENAVGPKAPSRHMSPPSPEPTPLAGPVHSPEPPTGESGTEGPPSVGIDETGSHSGGGGVNAGPTPATTVPGARSSPPVPGPIPPPPPQRHAFSAELVGTMRSDSPGDPDGRGTAALDVGPGGDELCLTLSVSGIAPVTAVHLHADPAGVSGRVLAAWTGPTPGGCVAIDDQVLRKLKREPAKYYVDVHTTEFPNGALRGPVTK